eukprot:TRINITY_DN1735_c0_g1_i2.p1 TRINITY_DN1735_c0_g1~~TRINITY_DN1735_c0_g1_i2.p1  ORF type:complete len:109 (+),score=35.25 TRINITY_DN1735_c0_g1_i2:299-625(+)
MMVPTLSTYTPEGREYCIALPASLQSNPPQPTDPEVTVVEKEAMVVFAATLGGFPDNVEEADRLRNKLESDSRGGEVDFTSYMRLGYQSPYVLKNRQTDIMFKRKPIK